MTKQSNGQQARNSRTLAVITPNSQAPEYSHLDATAKIMPLSRWLKLDKHPDVEALTIDVPVSLDTALAALAASARTGADPGEVLAAVLESPASVEAFSGFTQPKDLQTYADTGRV